MRFDFGTVGVLRPPLDRRLTEFDSVEGVLFRVKVIASSEPRGLLIAEADQIRPRQAKDEEDQRVPLLPVVPNRELGDEIFRVEFDSNQTLLKVNDSLGDWRDYWTYLPVSRLGNRLDGLRFDPVNDKLPVDIRWIAVDVIK